MESLIDKKGLKNAVRITLNNHLENAKLKVTNDREQLGPFSALATEGAEVILKQDQHRN